MEQKDFLLPFLRITSDKQEHTVEEVGQKIAQQLNLGERARAQKHSNGTPVFTNLIAWCKVNLQKAHFIEDTQPGKFRITSIGLEELKKKPSELTVKYLLSSQGNAHDK